MKYSIKMLVVSMIVLAAFDSNAGRRFSSRSMGAKLFSHSSKGFKKHCSRHISSHESNDDSSEEESQSPQEPIAVVEQPIQQPIETPVVTEPVVTEPVVSQITFNSVKSQVFSSCTSCHSSFSQFSTVKAKINSIQQMVQGGHGNLTNEQLDLLNSWVAGGMAQ